jgi:hypothetical protein
LQNHDNRLKSIFKNIRIKEYDIFQFCTIVVDRFNLFIRSNFIVSQSLISAITNKC